MATDSWWNSMLGRKKKSSTPNVVTPAAAHVDGRSPATNTTTPTSEPSRPPDVPTTAGATPPHMPPVPVGTQPSTPSRAPAASSGTTPDWDTTPNILDPRLHEAQLSGHGSVLATRESDDYVTAQMSDGTFQRFDKKSQNTVSAGTWGNSAGGGVSASGIGVDAKGNVVDTTPAPVPTPTPLAGDDEATAVGARRQAALDRAQAEKETDPAVKAALLAKAEAEEKASGLPANPTTPPVTTTPAPAPTPTPPSPPSPTNPTNPSRPNKPEGDGTAPTTGATTTPPPPTNTAPPTGPSTSTPDTTKNETTHGVQAMVTDPNIDSKGDFLLPSHGNEDTTNPFGGLLSGGHDDMA